jgi:integrase
MDDLFGTHRLHAYVVVSLLTGIRTEEARALCWSHVVIWVADGAVWVPVTEAGFDHERFAIYIWRSVRAHGDTKTEKSRRTLELPTQAAEALRTHHVRQARQRLAAGKRWRDHGLVFASEVGTPLDASHVRRAFKAITKGRSRRELDAAGAAPLVRVPDERQRRSPRNHR